MPKKLKPAVWMAIGAALAVASLVLLFRFNFGQPPTPGVGNPPDHREFGKFIDRISVFGTVELAAGAAGDVWDFDGQNVDWEASGVVSLVSLSPQDNATGTGAKTVRVIGSDLSNEAQVEDVELTGIIPVSTLKSFLSPVSLTIVEVGSAGDEFALPAGAGVITATMAGGTVDVAAIRTDRDQSESRSVNFRLFKLVGRDVTVVIDTITVSSGQLAGGIAGTVSVDFLRKRGSAPWESVINSLLISIGDPIDEFSPPSFDITSGDLIRVRVTSDVAAIVSIQLFGNTYGPTFP